MAGKMNQRTHGLREQLRVELVELVSVEQSLELSSALAEGMTNEPRLEVLEVLGVRINIGAGLEVTVRARVALTGAGDLVGRRARYRMRRTPAGTSQGWAKAS